MLDLADRPTVISTAAVSISVGIVVRPSVSSSVQYGRSSYGDQQCYDEQQ